MRCDRLGVYFTTYILVIMDLCSSELHTQRRDLRGRTQSANVNARGARFCVYALLCICLSLCAQIPFTGGLAREDG